MFAPDFQLSHLFLSAIQATTTRTAHREPPLLNLFRPRLPLDGCFLPGLLAQDDVDDRVDIGYIDCAVACHIACGTQPVV